MKLLKRLWAQVRPADPDPKHDGVYIVTCADGFQTLIRVVGGSWFVPRSLAADVVQLINNRPIRWRRVDVVGWRPFPREGE